MFYFEHPEVVVTAIREVMDEVRSLVR